MKTKSGFPPIAPGSGRRPLGRLATDDESEGGAWKTTVSAYDENETLLGYIDVPQSAGGLVDYSTYDGILDPLGSATRAEAAAIMQQFIKNCTHGGL